MSQRRVFLHKIIYRHFEKKFAYNFLVKYIFINKANNLVKYYEKIKVSTCNLFVLKISTYSIRRVVINFFG